MLGLLSLAGGGVLLFQIQRAFTFNPYAQIAFRNESGGKTSRISLKFPNREAMVVLDKGGNGMARYVADGEWEGSLWIIVDFESGSRLITEIENGFGNGEEAESLVRPHKIFIAKSRVTSL